MEVLELNSFDFEVLRLVSAAMSFHDVKLVFVNLEVVGLSLSIVQTMRDYHVDFIRLKSPRADVLPCEMLGLMSVQCS